MPRNLNPSRMRLRRGSWWG